MSIPVILLLRMNAGYEKTPEIIIVYKCQPVNYMLYDKVLKSLIGNYSVLL